MKIRWDWIEEQLKGSETSQQLSTSITRLVQTLETMNLDQKQLEEVLSKFHELGLGHSIIPDKPAERWQQCMPGFYGVRDTVRVKADAYEGEKSWHNGRRGRVCAISGGMAVVIYDNAASADEQYYHLPTYLQRLV